MARPVNLDPSCRRYVLTLPRSWSAIRLMCSGSIEQKKAPRFAEGFSVGSYHMKKADFVARTHLCDFYATLRAFPPVPAPFEDIPWHTRVQDAVRLGGVSENGRKSYQ